MNSAKHAFYYMLSLVTLFIVALSFGNILFELINTFFPDIAKAIYYSSNSGLKSAISGLLIATPIFYFVMNKIYFNLKIGELKKDSEIRRWLTYFILFVSSVVVIGSLISILNNFLDGALTINFILKALTVLFIALIIFGFYFYDIKREDFKNNKLNKIFFFISLIIIIGGLVSAFLIVESPEEARNRKLDEKIIGNFNTIKYAIDDYYYKQEKLPENLNELKDSGDNYIFSMINPVTNLEYVYEPMSNDSYNLCTDFSSSNLLNEVDYYGNIWQHDKGYFCVKKEINSEIIINKYK